MEENIAVKMQKSRRSVRPYVGHGYHTLSFQLRNHVRRGGKKTGRAKGGIWFHTNVLHLVQQVSGTCERTAGEKVFIRSSHIETQHGLERQAAPPLSGEVQKWLTLRGVEYIFFKAVSKVDKTRSSRWPHIQKNMGDTKWNKWTIRDKRGHESAGQWGD